MSVIARFVFGKGVVATFLLRSGEHRVGRTADSDVFLADQSVSRFHAVLVVGPHAASVRDNRSRNGTYLDGTRVVEASLRHGSEVAFGDVSGTYEWIQGSVRDDSTCSGGMSLADPGGEITPAERRVFDLLVCGHSEKIIATRLTLSRHTVHNHVRRIYQAFGVHTRPELLAAVLSNGIRKR